MIIFNQIRHLLPRARAWRLTIDKTLRRFIEGLAAGLETDSTSSEFGDGSEMGDGSEFAGPFTGPIEFYDAIYLDVNPESTRQQDEYDEMLGIYPAANLTEQERRDRIAAAWSATGGQSPAYIQGVVQASGFDVYIHEWWDPDTGATRDPRVFITGPQFQLVNKRETSVPNIVAVGKGFDVGEAETIVGGIDGNEFLKNLKPVPDNPDYWPFFLYFGGETFLDYANVPAARRDEFEALLLKLCPAHLWIGLRINYV